MAIPDSSPLGITIRELGLILAIILIVGIMPPRLYWSSQLHRRHGSRYSLWFIFRRMGRSPYGRWFLQQHEQLDPAFRNDLEEMQRRASRWGSVVGVLCLLLIFIWVALSYRDAATRQPVF